MQKVINKLKAELHFHYAMKSAEKHRKKRINSGIKCEEPYMHDQDYIVQLEKAIYLLEYFRQQVKQQLNQLKQ